MQDENSRISRCSVVSISLFPNDPFSTGNSVNFVDFKRVINVYSSEVNEQVVNSTVIIGTSLTLDLC